ncbi:MAG: MFS transporter [Micromonosporaceae bacterium]
MYLASTRAARPTHQPAAAAVPVSGTVVALGLVSLVTDASAEMVTAVLPLYLMYGLGMGYLQLGMLDGLYTGATAMLRLGGGYLADRLGHPKGVAAAGYGLSALTKLGFPLVGASATGIGLVVGVDRAGKGIRTAPRDALITASMPAAALGRAFGVHRTMDTAGALLGPLLVFALLTSVAGGYDVVFSTSFCLAVVGVLILLFFVRSPAVAPRAERPRPRVGEVFRDRRLRRACLAAGVLGLATVGDMFLYVSVQQTAALPRHVLPLLPLGTAGAFMLAATPVGRLADRVGRWRLFLAGHAVLLVAYLLLIAGSGLGWGVAIVVLVLHGLFYAATDGVLMAYAGPLLAAPVRATGLAVVQTTQALTRAGGAVGFGVLAELAAPGAAFAVFGLALVAALALAAQLAKEAS